MPIKTLRIEFWISAFADEDETSGLCNINGIEETSKDKDCHCKPGFSGKTCFIRCEDFKFGEPGKDGNLDNCQGIVFLFL